MACTATAWQSYTARPYDASDAYQCSIIATLIIGTCWSRVGHFQNKVLLNNFINGQTVVNLHIWLFYLCTFCSFDLKGYCSLGINHRLKFSLLAYIDENKKHEIFSVMDN